MDSWKSLRHKRQLARGLSMRDWLALVQAWWALLGFNLALRWVHLDRLEKFTRPGSEKGPVPPDALVWALPQAEIGQPGRPFAPATHDLPAALPLPCAGCYPGMPFHPNCASG